MAKSALEDAKKGNVTAETVDRICRELDGAEDAVEIARAALSSKVGVMRNIRKRAKTEGINLKVLDDLRAEMRLDEDEMMQNELDRQRYSAFLQLPIGGQSELSFDVSEELKDDRAKYDAERDGYNFGKKGHPRNDNPFEAGTVAYVAWDGGWARGEKEHFEEPAAAAPKRGRKPKKGAGAEMGETAGNA